MSFQYGHFGEGFDVMTPTEEALRFGDLVDRRGTGVTVVKLIEIGEDSYGQPIYSESPREEKAFVERDGSEKILQTGTVKAESLRMFMKAPWARMATMSRSTESGTMSSPWTGRVHTSVRRL
jgi:hypothetical protein